MPVPAPFLLSFTTTGNPREGFITSTQQAASIPFEVKRVFWTYGTSPGFVRGRHANKTTEEVLVVVSGEVRVEACMGSHIETFVLDNPATGLYVPAMCWVNLYFGEGAIAVCLASTDYGPDDYVRNFEEFQRLVVS